jgi:hypothetical protein
LLAVRQNHAPGTALASVFPDIAPSTVQFVPGGSSSGTSRFNSL